MGYMRHHAIVVTETELRVEALREKVIGAVAGAQVAVSEVTPTAVNGYRSFFLAPDGSKEGREASSEGDLARAKTKDVLRASMASWVEVQFGDDDGETKIIDSDNGDNP